MAWLRLSDRQARIYDDIKQDIHVVLLLLLAAVTVPTILTVVTIIDGVTEIVQQTGLDQPDIGPFIALLLPFSFYR